MLGKMPNVIWLEGAFMESIKGWQSGWFYITEPRDPKWAVPPEFRSGIPMQLTSWKEKGLLWGSSEELTGLQSCLQTLVNKKLKLVNVIQVMLVRRILPANTGPSICGSLIRHSTGPSAGSSTRRTRTSGRCCSRAPRYHLPLPRTADSAQSAL